MITRTDDTIFVSPSALAIRWNYEPRTIQKWIKAGILPAHKIGPKEYRIEMRVAVAFERGQLKIGADNCSS